MTAETDAPLKNALALLTGIPVAEINKRTWKRIQQALCEIKESTPTVDVPEMRERYRRHLKFWPGIKVTLESFSKHWPELGTPKPILIIDNPTEEIPPNWLGFMVEKNIAWETANDGYNGPAGYAIVSNQFKFCPEAWKRECREAWAQRGGNVLPFNSKTA